LIAFAPKSPLLEARSIAPAHGRIPLGSATAATIALLPAST
jgi:hypothetical protein